ncbi:phosphodiesterase [Microvirga pudoricolor]|uniref:phosphodiesterase n=1 Tax=Microvirga pudoricolor TaxID=2778729 RepID=UPI001951E57B|nr:phosphodiesterase [Microvirga pudoricolor]MBM6592991.1 phosphodiesterase [Microvirga pudoricolor]
MLIAHISDFHVFSRAPETSLVRPDAAGAARKVVADIAAFRPRIDAVMLTGDLTDGGSTEDYALLRDILSPLSMPVFVVPGNHDKRPTLRAAFAGSIPFDDAEFLHYEAEVGGLRILALDTFVEGAVEGRLCRRRLEWIEERLARHDRSPLTIIMHHPPFPTGITELDHMGLVEGADEFGRFVAAQAGPVRILCGHVHRPVHGVWNNAFVAIAGSPAFQIELELDPAAPEPGPLEEPYAYFIHHLGEGGEFSVHTRYVRI